ncbi:hypothetical protein N792_08140 [Lysobacter concretionis Ko07 = DSM 16239]|uniref:Lipoprotein n=1 Tax=Lysobacter concretionis Ko07 = DSM 16239 TaxID=1122185 RepID=A0A0A0EKV3_9GAMM|nr:MULTISPECIES: DUF1190 domain-containing protein [Lysobacter]KGM51646.1 hypothetical protein N792_08140 [Lysobacter concretionis Ko07 = DSM 16239]QOD92292.1 DUF1190 domain-containing protein [Lysobacter sp. CW239]
MKRSRKTALVLMGTAPLLLVACSTQPEVQTREGLFTSVEACAEKTANPIMCREAFEQAQAQVAEASPKYASREDCEAEFGAGQCATQKTSTGHSFIGPLMTGFFLSQMLNGRGAALPNQMGNQTAAGATRAEPAFRSNQQGWLKPGPSSTGVPGSSGLAKVSAQPDRAMTVRRGGFGATSARRTGGSTGG